MKMLVVEDEVEIQREMASFLKKLSFSGNLEVAFCDNLREAKSLVEEGKAEEFCLISTDGRFLTSRPGSVFSPGLGLIFLEHLKSIDFSGHTIFYSAHDGQVGRLKTHPMLIGERKVLAISKEIGSAEKWAKEVHRLLSKK